VTDTRSAAPEVARALVRAGADILFIAETRHSLEDVYLELVDEAPLLLALALFTPLIAGWSIWVGIATSARTRDVRVAQQIATLASLPPVAVTALMSFSVIPQSLSVALAWQPLLVLVDRLGWRAVSAMFDRERLVTRSWTPVRRRFVSLPSGYRDGEGPRSQLSQLGPPTRHMRQGPKEEPQCNRG
jgi:hypothetical protein